MRYDTGDVGTIQFSILRLFWREIISHLWNQVVMPRIWEPLSTIIQTEGSYPPNTTTATVY